MWICRQCGTRMEEQFGSCWKCSTPREQVAAAAPSPASGEARWKLQYKTFRGTFASWDELFSRAAYFASELGPERVVSISHSADDSDGVVTVWYWIPENEITQQPQ